MLTKVALLGLLCALDLTAAAPQRGRGRNRGGGGGQTAQATAQEQAAQIPGGISEATDGSVIMDATVTVNGLDMRFKISGPADQFTTDSGVDGATQDPNTNGTLGLNVLLHGDGGQSFFDFPNQGVNSNLAGVALLAPDPNLFWGGGSGLERTDGVEHSQAVNDLITNVLPQVMAFDSSQVFFTGVSGGSLLLSGFMMPAHGAELGVNGVMLTCGGMPPQVDFVNADTFASTARVHWQSTQQELELLQGSIPDAVAAYEQLATAAGLDEDQINALQTVDNSPNGGHCEFDEQGFVSGVQLMANNFAVVMQGGDGVVDGIGNVNTGVVGNENLQFTGGN